MEPDTERDASLLLSPALNPSRHQPLRPAKSTAFKREERRKRKDRKRQDRLALELKRWEPLTPPPRPAAAASTSPSSAAPDTPWPCDPPPPPDPEPSAAWSWGAPAATPPPDPPQPPPPAPSPQAAAVEACRAFFGEHVDDDDDVDDEEDLMEEEANVARFFHELLDKDAALREFYREGREKGRFLCLVCEGSGARLGKRFAGCAALVQHAGSVARTKGRRLAHRAFAAAVGQLLGWSAGRTTALPPVDDADNAGACDQAEHMEDATQSSEMEMS